MEKRIGIVAKQGAEKSLDLAARIYQFLNSKQLRVVPEMHLAQAKDLQNGRELEDMYADLIVTVGGDGTVLRACMGAPEPETPILAVNMGRRGYLAEVEPDQVFRSLEEYLAGRYRVDYHSKLSLSLDGQHLADSLNEALVTSSSPFKLIHLTLIFDDEESVEFSADGVIISTPTGSTAHAFSAGGPILHSSLEAFNIVFVCPIGPVSSIVVPDTKKVKVRIGKNISARVTVDGAFEQSLPPGSEIVIEKARYSATFIRFGERFLSRSLTRLLSRGVKTSHTP